jgi:hypothetical protein
LLNLQSAFTRLLYSTARIEAWLGDGSRSVGTAFHFAFKIDEQQNLPLLVTNKHVVRGAVRAEFHLHECLRDQEGKVTGPTANSFAVSMNDFERQWFMHPDPDVDICVMPFEPLRRQAVDAGKDAFAVPLPEALIPNDETLTGLSAMEEVVMVGYPIGLWDTANNFPILRRGHTASHPATNFQGKPQGLVDMACFPGSSGSPILIVNEGGYGTAGGFSVGSRIHFLGVLFAGPAFHADGSVTVINIPTRAVATARTDIPIHLGYYVKASQLLGLRGSLFSAWNVR